MITFCCCSLKPHSYFLLINYITMATISAVSQNAGYELYTNSQGNGGVLFLVGLFVLYSIVMGVVAFAALMVFIFKDSWNNKFQQVYLKMAIIWFISGLAVMSVLLIYLVSAGNNPTLVATFVSRWFFSLLFMGLGLYWNLAAFKAVKESLGPVDDEEARPLNGGIVI